MHQKLNKPEEGTNVKKYHKKDDVNKREDVIKGNAIISLKDNDVFKHIHLNGLSDINDFERVRRVHKEIEKIIGRKLSKEEKEKLMKGSSLEIRGLF